MIGVVEQGEDSGEAGKGDALHISLRRISQPFRVEGGCLHQGVYIYL